MSLQSGEQLNAERYSYLRAACEVPPTDKVELFLAAARMIANATFGFKASDLIPIPSTLDEQLAADYAPEVEGVGVPSVNVFSPKKLRIDLFEIRKPPSNEFNEQIGKAYERVRKDYIASNKPDKKAASGRTVSAIRKNPLSKGLADIEKKHGFEPGKLTVVATTVSETTKKDYRMSGLEYGLRVDKDSDAGKVLLAKAEFITATLRKTNASRELLRDFVSDTDPLAISFIQIPGGTQPQHEEFLDRITKQIPQDGFHLRVLPPEWVPMIRIPEVS